MFVSCTKETKKEKTSPNLKLKTETLKAQQLKIQL